MANPITRTMQWCVDRIQSGVMTLADPPWGYFVCLFGGMVIGAEVGWMGIWTVVMLFGFVLVVLLWTAFIRTFWNGVVHNE